MHLAELCRLIDLPAEMAERVLAFDQAFDHAAIANETARLLSVNNSVERVDLRQPVGRIEPASPAQNTLRVFLGTPRSAAAQHLAAPLNLSTELLPPNRAIWEQAIKDIQAILGDDPAGVKILACLLRCACQTRRVYTEKGIPEVVFIDTMKFFSRFVNFHHTVYGSFAFTWAWWVPRQLSLNEFRIGSLEYETVETDTGRKIHIHIASDSDLSLPRLRESYLNARRFFADFFPAYANADMICESWMLCPVLHELLPTGSRVLAFQRAFDVYKVDAENEGFMQWVYGRKDIPPGELPELTSLQRKMKAHLLRGGKVGWAFGTLSRDPFVV